MNSVPRLGLQDTPGGLVEACGRREEIPRKRRSERIWIEPALVALFLVSVFVYFYHPLHDGDLWFHLNYGKWITENLSFPDQDPFASGAHSQDADRIPLFNRGYWLAQVAYYGLYLLDGFRGLNLFYALLMTGIFSVLWRILRREGFSPTAALVPLLPCVLLALYYYDELRPRNFSDLNILLLFGLLERGIREIRDQARGLTIRTMCLLPMLVILWANVYRGFIVLYAVLAAYLIGESLTHRFRRRMPGFAKFIAWIVLSGLASFAKPNFVRPAVEGFREIFQAGAQYSIIEMSRPWDYPALVGDNGTFLGCLGLVTAATAGVMILARRRLEFRHLLLYGGFALAGATAFRYAFSFVLISVAVSGRYAVQVAPDFMKRLRLVPRVLAAGFPLFLLTKSWGNLATGREYVESAVLPVKAVDFLLDNNLPQPILNPYNWGGYISWRAYPRYKVFIDSRGMDPSVLTRVLLAEGRRGPVQPLLEEYGIQTVLYNYSDHLGNFPRIILDLLVDQRWQLVYVDEKAVIFVRSGGVPSLTAISKQRLSDLVLRRVLGSIREHPGAADGYFDLATVYHALGNKGDAMEAYQKGVRLQGKE